MMDKELLYKYCLRLGDDHLILGQRLAEWCGHAPILEEDVALTNLSLDLFGAASALYSYAAEVEGEGRTDDDIAFKRNERQYFNHLLVEQPNGDFANTIVRQVIFDIYILYLCEALNNSDDQKLAAIASKTIKETKYHLRHSGQWLIRLGDGTEESHKRAQNALNHLWMFTGELFEMHTIDKQLLKKGIGVDMAIIKTQWNQTMDTLLEEAKLEKPAVDYMQTGGLQGIHTEHLGHLLAEMQYLRRAYPDAKWY